MQHLEIVTSAATAWETAHIEAFSARVLERVCELYVERYIKDLLGRFFRQAAMLASLEPYIRKLEKKMMRHFRKMDTEVQAKLNRWPKTTRAMNHKQEFNVEDFLFNQSNYHSALADDIRNHTTQPLIDGGNGAMGEIGAGTSFDQTDPRVLEFLAMNPKNAAFNITQTQYDKLKAVLLKAQTEGWNIKKIRRLIAEKLEMAYRRAELIARTEVLKSSNKGAYRAFYQSGVVEGVQWDAAMDKRTCPMCAQMDGATMPLGKPFFEQGETVTFTGTEEVPAPKGEMVYAFDYEEIQHPPLHPS